MFGMVSDWMRDYIKSLVCCVLRGSVSGSALKTLTLQPESALGNVLLAKFLCSQSERWKNSDDAPDLIARHLKGGKGRSSPRSFSPSRCVHSRKKRNQTMLRFNRVQGVIKLGL